MKLLVFSIFHLSSFNSLHKFLIDHTLFEIAINNSLTWLTDLITTVESKYFPRLTADDIDIFYQTVSFFRVGLFLILVEVLKWILKLNVIFENFEMNGGSFDQADWISF